MAGAGERIRPQLRRAVERMAPETRLGRSGGASALAFPLRRLGGGGRRRRSTATAGQGAAKLTNCEDAAATFERAPGKSLPGALLRGCHVSPDASRPAQRTSTQGRPQRILNVSSSCTSCSVSADHRQRRIASQRVWRRCTLSTFKLPPRLSEGRRHGRRRWALNASQARWVVVTERVGYARGP